MICRVSETTFESDYTSKLVIELGGIKLSFCDGEPEDNNLGRNFNDELGTKGEPLEFVRTERTVGADDIDEDDE